MLEGFMVFWVDRHLRNLVCYTQQRLCHNSLGDPMLPSHKMLPNLQDSFSLEDSGSSKN